MQRKCACGFTYPERECARCRRDRLGLQRTAMKADQPAQAPPIVHDVLNSPGQPLDADVRLLMESRLGHDFSRVRVNIDAAAAASARAARALAYTVGHRMVFGAGRYVPRTSEGRRLLAHELTHVVQQEKADKSVPTLAEDASLEREAEATADRVLLGLHPQPIHTNLGRPVVQRNGEPIPVELTPTSPEEVERLKKMGVELPKVSKETWRSIGGVADNAGEPLTDEEKKRIVAITKTALPAGPVAAFPEGPRFVLHDTAAAVGAARLATLQTLGRGPLGESAAAYVPTSGGPVIARPTFFEASRPTASEYEKAEDILTQAKRETAFRAVWKATKTAERQPALDSALSGLGLTAAEVKTEQTAATSQLNAGSGKVFTTASWAVREICKKATDSGVKNVAASSAQEAQLTAGCATLKPYYEARQARVGSEVNVEIVQEAGSDCSTTGKLTPLPAYTEDQYKSVASLYLQAALQAGRFPEVTTHFWVDRAFKGHCDPRCFDLMHLYDTVSSLLGYGKGSTYGAKPNYGTTWGTHNVWWNDTVCGKSHP
jgi:hypothetical protein